MLFSSFFQRFRRIRKTPLFRPAMIAIAVIIYGVFSEYALQYNNPNSGVHSLFDSLWWVMQTVTTVGYGDTPVVGFYARLNGIFIMVAGIGSVGYFLANLGSNLVDSRLAKRLGEVKTRMKNHVIICNYSEYSSGVVADILKEGNSVLLMSQKKPQIQDVDVEYVNGSCLNMSDLKKAGIDKCGIAVILPDRAREGSETNEVDAKTIVSVATVKKANPNTYVIAELLSRENIGHATDLGADEVIVAGEISSRLIADSVINPGISKIYNEMFMPDGRLKIEEIQIDTEKRSLSVFDLRREFEKENRIILGFRTGDNVTVNLNPSARADYDYALVISGKN